MTLDLEKKIVYKNVLSHQLFYSMVSDLMQTVNLFSLFQANALLHRICKAGNGCIPKPPKKEGLFSSLKRSKERPANPTEPVIQPGMDVHGATSAEEKLARSANGRHAFSKDSICLNNAID